MSVTGGRASWIAGIGPWAGVGTNPAGIMVGGGLAASLTGPDLLVAIVVGLVVLGLLGVVHGEVGRQQGQPALAVLLGPLGPGASPLAGAAIALMMIGWLGVNAGVAGAALGRLTGLPQAVGVALFVVVMSAVAWQGLRALSWFAVAAGVATVGIAIWGMSLARGAAPTSPPALGADIGILGGAALVVGFGAAFALRSPDFTRVAAARSQVIGNALFGLCLPLAAFLAAGVVLQRASGQWNLAEVLVSLGSGEVAYLLLAIGFSGSVLTNLYSGALAIQLVAGGGYHRALLICALVGGALATAGVADRLLAFLGVMAVAASSLLVLSVAHHLMAMPSPRGRGVVAWAAGVAVGSALTFVLPDLALPVAAVVTLAIYLSAGSRPRPALP